MALKTEIDLKQLKKSTPKSTPFWQKDIDLGGLFSNGNKSLSKQEKEYLFTELRSLLDSGIDLALAIKIIQNQAGKKSTFYSVLLKNLINGLSFWESLQLTNAFSNYEVYSIRIGEESGKLSHILLELSQFHKDRNELNRQIINTLSYPVFILSVAIGVVFFMITYIIPLFKDVFDRFGGQLPYLTRIILAISEQSGTIMAIVALLLGVPTLIYYFNYKKPAFQLKLSTILIKIPFIGTIVLQIALAQFCRSLQLLIYSGTSLHNALELVSNMMRLKVLQDASTQLRTDILNGKTLHAALAQQPIFPSRVLALIEIGESVGKLDTMFGKLADYYANEAKNLSARYSKLLEPFLILIIALLVGIILLSMYLPLFNMGEQIN